MSIPKRHNYNSGVLIKSMLWYLGLRRPEKLQTKFGINFVQSLCCKLTKSIKEILMFKHDLRSDY